GSSSAAAQGAASQQRGLAMEARTAQALEKLAARLNSAGGASPRYRVVTSMQVPAAIGGERERAKSEWDAVLLKQDAGAVPDSPWDICLLAEAKASIDAAATDLPRLLRGMRLLARATPGRAYPFQTAQETTLLNGLSMNRLSTDAHALARTVLYCCDAPAEAVPRLLSAASRMQLLSATASLEFGGALAQGRPKSAQALAPVWRQLCESPGWQAVLNQYPMLRQARELMVHPDDLQAAIDSVR
ncbi:3-deoxy-D-arabino-heptulosonate 7-phosphate synthase, partial [Bordetella petrii]|nr:3-deoxy-D-arabino-heptulosonate 7-phosphate synthase [Bordetella petrii]